MRMIEAAIGVICVSCFVGPPLTLLATLNLFDNPASIKIMVQLNHYHFIKIIFRRDLKHSTLIGNILSNLLTKLLGSLLENK